MALKDQGFANWDHPVRLGNPKNGSGELTALADAGPKLRMDAYAGSVGREIRTWHVKGSRPGGTSRTCSRARSRRPVARTGGRPCG